MLRIRVIADVHLHEWKAYARIDSQLGINTRLLAQVNAFKRLCTADSTDGGARPHVLCILGDLTHLRGRITPSVQWAVAECLACAADNYRLVYVLPGNHDYELRAGSPDLHSLWGFARYRENVHVISRPELVNLPGGQLAIVPWMESGAAVAEAVAKLAQQATPTTALLAHVAVTGARMDNGRPYAQGLALSALQPDRFGAVLLGDFHHRQQLAPNVWYVGAPYHMTWADADREDEGALDVELVAGRAPSVSHVPSKAARFMEVDTGHKAKVAAELGHYVRIPAEVAQQQGTDDWLRESGVQIMPPPPPEPERARLDVRPDSDPLTVLDAYLATLPVVYEGMEDTLVPATIRQMAVEVINEVRMEAGASDTGRRARVELTRLVLVNFLSYAHLDVKLSARGVVLVDGINEDDPDADSNGAGKSALIEGIYYALTGRTLRGVPVDRVVRRGARDNVVILDMRVDGNSLTVTRNRGHRDYPPGLTMLYNGRRVEAADHRAAQAELYRMIGMDDRTLRQVVLFGQGVEELFAAATDAQRKELLEQLCGGEQFAPLYAKAKENRDEANKVLSELDNEYSRLSADIRVAASEVDHLSRLIDTTNRSNRVIGASQDVLRRQIEKLQGELTAIQLGSARRDMLARKLAEKTAEVRALESAAVKAEREYRAAEAAADGLRAEQKRVQELVDGNICPTCTSRISADAGANLMRNVQTRLEAMMAVEDEKFRAVEAAKALHRQEERNLRALQHWKNRADDRSRRGRGIEAELARLRRQLDAQQEVVAEPVDLIAKRAEAQARLEALVAKRNSLHADMEWLKGTLRYMDEVVRLFGPQGLRTFLLDAMAPRIQTAANEALRILSSGTLSIRFTTERRGNAEKLVLEVNNDLGADTYEGNSGGQKRKVDLALCWAISGLVEDRINLLAIDEAMDALDATAGDRLTQLLEQRSETRGTILVTTHRSEFKTQFRKVWTARLKNGVSTLEGAD